MVLDGLSGVLSVQRHTERTCALTLMVLSFTMMLSDEFNYLGLHIKAFYFAATLRSQSWKLNHTKDRLLQQRTQRHPFITNYWKYMHSHRGINKHKLN